jgi:hypothetical protein
MDSITTLTLALSLFSTGIAVFSLVYTKRQVDMQRRDFEKRKNFEKASSTILLAIGLIKDNQKPIVIDGLHPIQTDVVKELYDNPHTMGLILKIKPGELRVNVGNNKAALIGGSLLFGGGKVIKIIDSQHLINVLIESEKEHSSIEGSLIFNCEPKILSTNLIEIDNLLYELKMYYAAYRLLSEIEDLTQPIDNTIIGNVKKTIDNLTTILFESSKNEHTLLFQKDEKSPSIFDKLNYGIIPLGVIVDMRKALISLCDSKLMVVQKKMFEMSFQ